MVDLVTKISDIKKLQELSGVFVIPLTVTAYILQTGIEIEGNPSETGQFIYYFNFLSIFLEKTVLATTLVFILYEFLNYLNSNLRVHLNCSLFPVVAMVLLSFGFYFLFSEGGQDCKNTVNAMQEKSQLNIHSAWTYVVFTAAFFLLHKDAQYRAILKKISHNHNLSL